MSLFHLHSPTSHEIWQLSPSLGTNLSRALCSVRCSPSVQATAGEAPLSQSYSALNYACCLQLPPTCQDEASTGQRWPEPNSWLIHLARFLQECGWTKPLLHYCWEAMTFYLMADYFNNIKCDERRTCVPQKGIGTYDFQWSYNEYSQDHRANFKKSLIKHLISHHFFSWKMRLQ